VYHLQLRQFPHNLCRFNLTDVQLHPVVEPWANNHWVELGERKWSPHQAKLTILEGPQLPVQQLSMGRGWRNAQRGGRDVTEQVLAAARQASARQASARQSSAPVREPTASSPAPAPDPSSETTLLADSLALELLSLLERERPPVPLSQAWRLAQARLPDRTASASLALAEQAVMSLLGRRLIVLLPNAPHPPDAHDADGGGGGVLESEAIDPALRALDSWLVDGRPAAIHMRRA
jgi:hypothetical protein